jgi:hypothetical protein
MSVISREIYHQKLNEYYKLFSVVTIKDVEKPSKETTDGLPIKIVKRQYEIGGIKKNGIIKFYNNAKEFSLEFTFIEIKRSGQPEKYSQKLFLPITYSIEQILDIVRNDIFKYETKIVKTIELNDMSDISNDIIRIDNLKEIQFKLEKLKDKLFAENLLIHSRLLEEENTELKQQRGIYSSLDKSNMRTGALQYLSHRKEKVMPIQKSIYDLKKKHKNIYNVELSQVLENIDSKDLLLELLNIDLQLDDIINRPRVYKGEPVMYNIKTKYTDKNKNENLFKIGETLTIGVPNGKPGSHKNDESTNFSNYVITTPSWRKLLSVTDKSIPVKIDDFTFKSILHYHIASQFYNRIDLNDTFREKYNKFFLTFTDEYEGDDKLYSASIQDILEIIKREKYKQYYLWNSKSDNYCNRDGTLCQGRSISQNFRIKAYLNKFTQNSELKQLLLSTNQSKLIEKKHKNEYEVNYELMDVRSIIENDNVDEFIAFNYDPKVKELLQKRNKDENHDFLNNLAQINLFEIANTKEEPLEYAISELLIIMPTIDIPKVTKTLKDVFFSYIGNHIYQLCVENDITYTSEFIKKFPHLSNNVYIIDFITGYLKELNDLSLPKVTLANISQISNEEAPLEVLDKELENIKKKFKTYKRRIIEVHNSSLINSIIDQMIRQKKYPFNFINQDDTRDKYPSDYVVINGKKNFKNAYKLIRNNISRIIEINSKNIYPKSQETIEAYLQNTTGKLFHQIVGDISNEYTDKYWEDDLELLCLSRLFGIDITINFDKKILFNDTLSIFTNLPDDIMNYSHNVGHVVIGNSEGKFYSTQLNITQLIRDNQFLIDKQSGTIIHEEMDGTFEYFGILNMNDLTINITAEMIDLSGQTDSDEEIELGILELYRIDNDGNRPTLYYGETELIYTF